MDYDKAEELFRILCASALAIPDEIERFRALGALLPTAAVLESRIVEERGSILDVLNTRDKRDKEQLGQEVGLSRQRVGKMIKQALANRAARLAARRDRHVVDASEARGT